MVTAQCSVNMFWVVRWSGKLGWFGAVYLVDCLDGQCGHVGQVVGMRCLKIFNKISISDIFKS